ncbi:MAG: hypothetical protein DRJ33_02740 [Candidatus Methanomethylicota archaeon]|uniref:Fucose isomerase n=1 Tax=Thermoproteota archaeon TaxID=2056631 RepID=A0A497F010_9CREN|nr:MAG: hypothetical protein DRJ33_02740 [Candidatus Verstraetearchaeota archaeon]
MLQPIIASELILSKAHKVLFILRSMRETANRLALKVVFKLKTSILVIPLASKLHPLERLKARIDEVKAYFEKMDAKVEVYEVLSSFKDFEKLESVEADLYVIMFLTGGTSRLGYRLYLQLPHPKVLLAHRGDNSFPSAMEAKARLKLRGLDAELYLTDLSSLTVLEKLKQLSLGGRIFKALKNAKVGLVSSFERWYTDRLKLVNVRPEELLKILNEKSVGFETYLRKLKAYKVFVKEDALADALKLYFALKRIVEDKGLKAIAVNCFEIIKLKGITPCIAFALLNDEGIPAICEADLNAGLIFLALYMLSGSAWMGNITSYDEYENTLTLAHCTAMFKLAEGGSVSLKTHFETDQSVSVDVELKQGKVTLASTSLDGGFIAVTTGRIVASSLGRPDLCRTQVKVKLNVPVSRYLKEIEANHQVLAYGNFVESLKAFSWALNLKFKEVL